MAEVDRLSVVLEGEERGYLALMQNASAQTEAFEESMESAIATQEDLNAQLSQLEDAEAEVHINTDELPDIDDIEAQLAVETEELAQQAVEIVAEIEDFDVPQLDDQVVNVATAIEDLDVEPVEDQVFTVHSQVQDFEIQQVEDQVATISADVEEFEVQQVEDQTFEVAALVEQAEVERVEDQVFQVTAEVQDADVSEIEDQSYTVSATVEDLDIEQVEDQVIDVTADVEDVEIVDQVFQVTAEVQDFAVDQVADQEFEVTAQVEDILVPDTEDQIVTVSADVEEFVVPELGDQVVTVTADVEEFDVQEVADQLVDIEVDVEDVELPNIDDQTYNVSGIVEELDDIPTVDDQTYNITGIVEDFEVTHVEDQVFDVATNVEDLVLPEIQDQLFTVSAEVEDIDVPQVDDQVFQVIADVETPDQLVQIETEVADVDLPEIEDQSYSVVPQVLDVDLPDVDDQVMHVTAEVEDVILPDVEDQSVTVSIVADDTVDIDQLIPDGVDPLQLEVEVPEVPDIVVEANVVLGEDFTRLEEITEQDIEDIQFNVEAGVNFADLEEAQIAAEEFQAEIQAMVDKIEAIPALGIELTGEESLEELAALSEQAELGMEALTQMAEQLRNELDPTAAQIEELTQAQELLNNMLEAGVITQDEYAQAMELNRERLDSLADGSDGAGSSIGSMTGEIAAAIASVTALAFAIKGLVSTYGVQEDAEVTLQAALQATGKDVDTLFTRYANFASGLQQLTRVGDEATLGMLKLAEALGVTGSDAERAVKEAMGLAAVVGMNERAAIRYTAMLAQGDTMMLRRYVPSLRLIKDEAEQVATAHRELGNMFEVAAASAQTTIGQITQAGNAFGDLMEKVGGVIAILVTPLAGALKVLFELLQEIPTPIMAIISGMAAWAAISAALKIELIKTAVVGVGKFITSMAMSVAGMIKWIAAKTAMLALLGPAGWALLAGAVAATAVTVGALTAGLTQSKKEMKDTKDAAKGMGEEIEKTKEIVTEFDQALQNLNPQIKNIRDLFKKSPDELRLEGQFSLTMTVDEEEAIRRARDAVAKQLESVNETIGTMRTDNVPVGLELVGGRRLKAFADEEVRRVSDELLPIVAKIEDDGFSDVGEALDAVKQKIKETQERIVGFKTGAIPTDNLKQSVGQAEKEIELLKAAIATIDKDKELPELGENLKRIIASIGTLEFVKGGKLIPSSNLDDLRNFKTTIDGIEINFEKELRDEIARMKEWKEVTKKQAEQVAVLRREGENLRRSVQTPFEKSRDDLERYKELLAASVIDEETYRRAVEKTNEQLEKAREAEQNAAEARRQKAIEDQFVQTAVRGSQEDIRIRAEADLGAKVDHELEVAKKNEDHNKRAERHLNEIRKNLPTSGAETTTPITVETVVF